MSNKEPIKAVDKQGVEPRTQEEIERDNKNLKTLKDLLNEDDYEFFKDFYERNLKNPNISRKEFEKRAAVFLRAGMANKITTIGKHPRNILKMAKALGKLTKSTALGRAGK